MEVRKEVGGPVAHLFSEAAVAEIQTIYGWPNSHINGRQMLRAVSGGCEEAQQG